MKCITAVSSVAAAALVGVVATVMFTGRTDAVASPQGAERPAGSAKEVRGPTPYLVIENEPPPKLIVDEALPDLLSKGIVLIQYRTENVRTIPVFGKAALDVSPRVGHLHIHLDDLPWFWADPSNLNTIDIGGLPPGDHKVIIELVDAAHQPFPGQSKTVKFTVPETGSLSH